MELSSDGEALADGDHRDQRWEQFGDTLGGDSSRRSWQGSVFRGSVDAGSTDAPRRRRGYRYKNLPLLMASIWTLDLDVELQEPIEQWRLLVGMPFDGIVTATVSSTH
jgi:hypothetical protein